MNIFRISTLWVPDHHLRMDWENPERPALKKWTIKAFDGNLFLAVLFAGVLCLAVIGGLWLAKMEWWWNLLMAVFIWATIMNTFLLKRVCVTRLTEVGGEVFKWRAIPNFIFASMPWLIALYAGLVLWGFTFSPEVGLGALAGGGGMGILYAVVFTSEDYKKSQLALRHWTFSWDEIYEAIYDCKGHAIGFNVVESKPYLTRFKEENENFYGCRIYFHPKMAEEVLRLFKEKLGPGIPMKEGRIHYRTID